MDELISIIVPAYNIEQYLERCLNSLMVQTYKNLEILVINDGSTDKTKEVAEGCASQDNRITVITTKNQGVSAARNYGIDLATGKYIGFIDGDDEAEEDMYELLLKNALTYDADISHCGYKMVYPTKVVEYYGTGIKKIQCTKDAVADLLRGYPIEPGLCNKLYKKELLQTIRLNSSIKYNEDLLANFYLFSLCRKSVFYDVAKYHYILRKDSACISNINKKKLADPVSVWEEILESLINEKELYLIALKRYLYILAKNTLYASSAADSEVKSYQQICRRKLRLQLKKESVKKFKKDLRTKLLIYGAAYCPIFIRYLKHLYDNWSGNKIKYKLT